MNDQAMRFRFGVFVLGSFILLAVLTILFGGFPNYFKQTENYTIIFDTAQGVSAGTPVRRSGVRIGEVRGVGLDNVTGKVRVGIRIDGDFMLRKGDRPTLIQGLLGGDTSIAFLPPDDNKKLVDDPGRVEPNAVLLGFTAADPGALMQKTSDLVEPTKEVLLEIKKVFQRLDKIAPVIDATLTDFREIGKMVREVGPELKKTTDEIRTLARITTESIPEIKKTNEELRLTVRTWGRVGERTDVLIKLNEEKITRSIEQMETSLKRINDLFNDENQKYLRETLKNVRDGSQQIESLAKDTSELIKDSRITVRQVSESLKKADSAIGDLQKMMKPVGERGPTVLKNLEETTTTLNHTLKDLRELIQVVARSEGTVQKLLTDPGLYNNLNDSATMVTKILPRLDRVLHDVEIFADKLARHPELIGIGGVVRPSSGLKDAPTTPPPPYRIFPRH